MASATRRMHQTTIRFGPDTWLALEREAALLGVSAAQFVRDATLARLAVSRSVGDAEETYRLHEQDESAEGTVSASAAVRSESQMVRKRAARLRADSERIRANRQVEEGANG